MSVRYPFADVERVVEFLKEEGYDEYTARMLAASVVKRWARSPPTKAAAREER